VNEIPMRWSREVYGGVDWWGLLCVIGFGCCTRLFRGLCDRGEAEMAGVEGPQRFISW
jgi:hypothetical protein